MSHSKDNHSKGQSGADEKEDRLAKALRENLRKRKKKKAGGKASSSS